MRNHTGDDMLDVHDCATAVSVCALLGLTRRPSTTGSTDRRLGVWVSCCFVTLWVNLTGVDIGAYDPVEQVWSSWGLKSKRCKWSTARAGENLRITGKLYLAKGSLQKSSWIPFISKTLSSSSAEGRWTFSNLRVMRDIVMVKILTCLRS